MSFGAIVAIARVTNCVVLDQVPRQSFAEGPICWLLDDVRPVEPFPFTGALSLFNVPDEIVNQLKPKNGAARYESNVRIQVGSLALYR